MSDAVKRERRKASLLDAKLNLNRGSGMFNSTVSWEPKNGIKNTPILNRCRSDIQPPCSRTPSPDSALENLVKCPICAKRFSNPKMLSCQHTFCLQCLQLEFNHNEDKTVLICPTCSGETEMPETFNLLDLPNNLYINSLIRVLEEQINSSNQQRCFRCKTNCAVVEKCCHCSQHFCTICWDTHMNELSKQIEQLNLQLNSAVEKMSHKLENYKVQFDKLNEKIGITFDEKIALLMNKKQELLDESQQLYNSGENEHRKIVQKIDGLRKSITDIADAGSDAAGSDDEATTFLSLHSKITEIFSQISHWGEERTLFNLQSLTIEVHSKTNGSKGDQTPVMARKKQNHVHSEESLENYYRNKQFKPSLIWSKCSRPSGIGIAPWMYKDTNIQLLYIAGTECRLIYGINRINGHIMHEISHEDMIFPHAIAFSVEREEIFVSDKWKHCIFVFTKYGELLRVLGGKGAAESLLRAPEGIAIGHNNTIYVCDTGNDRIQCLNHLDGRMIMQFGLIRKDQIIKAIQTKTICNSVDLNSPTAIALHNDLIIVLDTGNKRVKTFNKHGQIIHEFGQLGSLSGQFKHPEALAVDAYGFIFIGDSGNARVQVFRQNGEFLTVIGSRGGGQGKFNWVSGVHVSPNFEIIVSDYKNHAVQIFK